MDYAVSTKYFGSGSAEVFDVSRMNSAISYTGAVSGGPNKTVNLSAKLVDGLGRPLAGKSVQFQVGTQSPPAVATNSSGVASTSLKLSQKNGKYLVSATWTPAGTDADRWTGASTSVAFNIQSK